MKITDGFVVCGVTSTDGDLGPICQFPTRQEAANWLADFWDDPENPGTLHPRYQHELYRIAEYQDGAPTGSEWWVDSDGNTIAM